MHCSLPLPLALPHSHSRSLSLSFCRYQGQASTRVLHICCILPGCAEWNGNCFISICSWLTLLLLLRCDCHCYCCFCFCCVLTNEISVSHFDCLVSSLSIRGWGGGCLFVSKQAQLFNVIGKCEHAHVFVFVWETERVREWAQVRELITATTPHYNKYTTVRSRYNG